MRSSFSSTGQGLSVSIRPLIERANFSCRIFSCMSLVSVRRALLRNFILFYFFFSPFLFVGKSSHLIPSPCPGHCMHCLCPDIIGTDLFLPMAGHIIRIALLEHPALVAPRPHPGLKKTKQSIGGLRTRTKPEHVGQRNQRLLVKKNFPPYSVLDMPSDPPELTRSWFTSNYWPGGVHTFRAVLVMCAHPIVSSIVILIILSRDFNNTTHLLMTLLFYCLYSMWWQLGATVTIPLHSTATTVQSLFAMGIREQSLKEFMIPPKARMWRLITCLRIGQY
ncbi:conserved hypothetical protein [Coccidioides posadasii str. Silveira]|uniref:Uncharacterized protein n=1 Tax=Coccidioides posadasii (strain RMSCC 757 / Silveira) TaxID=443226 RepID=E9DDP9_COCPS|nr:conserved hypothetical protein [Coccidioides posadasii str. Silveira]